MSLIRALSGNSGGRIEEVTGSSIIIDQNNYINIQTNGKACAVWFAYHRNSEADKYYCAIDGMPVAFYSEGGVTATPTFADNLITTNFRPYSANTPIVTECWVIYV